MVKKYTIHCECIRFISMLLDLHCMTFTQKDVCFTNEKQRDGLAYQNMVRLLSLLTPVMWKRGGGGCWYQVVVQTLDPSVELEEANMVQVPFC